MYTSSQRRPPEAFCIKRCGKHLYFCGKHLQCSFFLKAFWAWTPVTLFKITSTQVFSCKIFESFKNTSFEEHLRTTASERLRKISPLLALRNATLDGKRHNWATNSFYWKHEPHEVNIEYSHYTIMPFFISFKLQKRTKVTGITILKYLEPSTVVEQC